MDRPFRFDAQKHEYWDMSTGALIPHITQLLEQAGWTDSTWCTAKSQERGIAVHQLTANFDLGALDVETHVSPYRSWLLAHQCAMNILRPSILAVEQPDAHPTLNFAGRPDREVILTGLQGVLEIKSGLPEEGHAIQTALQAMLIAPKRRLPTHSIGRWCLYLKGNGKFRLEQHRARADFDEARRIIKRWC